MKKIIAIMLALAFVLAFSACKKADNDNSGADETSTVSSAEATSIEADSKTQEYIDNFTNSTIENPAESIEIAGQNVSASAGQSVTVPVTVTENSRIGALDLTVSYDTDKLEYSGFESSGKSLVTDNEVEPGTVRIAVIDANGLADSALGNLEFKSKDGVSGETKVVISCNTCVDAETHAELHPTFSDAVINIG